MQRLHPDDPHRRCDGEAAAVQPEDKGGVGAAAGAGLPQRRGHGRRRRVPARLRDHQPTRSPLLATRASGGESRRLCGALRLPGQHQEDAGGGVLGGAGNGQGLHPSEGSTRRGGDVPGGDAARRRRRRRGGGGGLHRRRRRQRGGGEERNSLVRFCGAALRRGLQSLIACIDCRHAPRKKKNTRVTLFYFTTLGFPPPPPAASFISKCIKSSAEIRSSRSSKIISPWCKYFEHNHNH